VAHDFNFIVKTLTSQGHRQSYVHCKSAISETVQDSCYNRSLMRSDMWPL